MSLKPPNPEDSIRSTWRRQDKKDWMWQLWVIDLLNIHHVNLDQPVPKHPKTDKVPYVKQWSHTLWVSFFSVLSLLVHQLLLEVTGYYNPSAWVVGAYYFIAYQAILTNEVHILRRLAHKYGFFDGDQHERNEVPDVGVPRAFSSLMRTLGSRVVMNILVAYDGRSPFEFMSNPSWWTWLVVKLALYPVILDFYFYSYHRIMHEVPFLWKFHRKHHLIKHPVPLLSAYADDEQEFFDMVGVPLLTYLTLYAFGIRLGYYDWWVCHQFITYTEAWGHSGLRLYSSAPSTIDWLLPLLKLDLTVEDHDLHHRKGWRKSANYGKQTLIWDRAFGTAGERIEVADENIDRSHGVRMPLF